jgi:energy-coupling factor transport system permease protein
MRASPSAETGGAEGIPHAGARLLAGLTATVLAVALSNPASLILLLVCSAVYAFTLVRPKILLAAYLASTVMFVSAAALAALTAFFIPIPGLGAAAMFPPFMRMGIAINAVLPLAFAAPVQDVLAALKGARLPFRLYLPLTVAVRFIPAFLLDIRQIYETIVIRRGDSSAWSLARRPLLLARLMVMPLIFRALKGSEDLGLAAELKGMGPERPFLPYRVARWRRKDAVLLALALSVGALAVFLHFAVPEDAIIRGAAGFH